MPTETEGISQDVKITVTGDDSEMMAPFATQVADQKLYPTGVGIRYGINSIPTATLILTPEDSALICRFDEKWRRAAVKIRVETPNNGCMTFRGLVDGLSLGQGVGDMKMQLVVKSPFQLLHEINPKMLGFHSAGTQFATYVDSLVYEQTGTDTMKAKFLLGANITTDLDAPLFKGIVDIIKAVIQAQKTFEYHTTETGLRHEPAVEAAKSIKLKHLAIAEKLLDKIDYSFVSTSLTLADATTVNWVLENLCSHRSSVLEVLMSTLESVGCALVFGNDKAFIVPNSGYLKQTHETEIEVGKKSGKPNIIYPAQYNSVSFEDNGYKDIAGVYMHSDARGIGTSDGFYLDKTSKGTGGIIGETMPMVISMNNALARTLQQKNIKSSVSDTTQSNTAPAKGSKAAATHEAMAVNLLSIVDIESKLTGEEKKKALKSAQVIVDAMQAFAEQWAELRYYQLKFNDRVGGILCYFDRAMAPGCVGSVYLRHPGVYIDFFVTEVRHDISVNTPNHATATTSVHFNCGRMGSLISAELRSGVDGFTLFDGFSAKDSAKVAAAFVKDIST